MTDIYIVHSIMVINAYSIASVYGYSRAVFLDVTCGISDMDFLGVPDRISKIAWASVRPKASSMANARSMGLPFKWPGPGRMTPKGPGVKIVQW